MNTEFDGYCLGFPSAFIRVHQRLTMFFAFFSKRRVVVPAPDISAWIAVLRIRRESGHRKNTYWPPMNADERGFDGLVFGP